MASPSVLDDATLVAMSELSTMNLASLTGRANLGEEVSRHWALNCLRKEPLFDQKLFDQWVFDNGIAGDASSLSAELRQKVEQVYVGVSKNRKGRGTEPPPLQVENKRGSWSVSVGKVTIRCSNAVFQRLKAAHEKHSVTTDFHEDLARVLLRYDAVNSGHQIAVLPSVTKVFRERLEVSAECFASPLNAQMDRYCSAFVDSDCSFGSLGSFFNFRPTSGSFEMNPPFIEHYLEKILKHVEQLLKDATGALQFVVVIPRWNKKHCYTELAESQWTTRKIRLKLKEHKWLNATTGKPKDASNDTSVLFMQNALAKEKWSISLALISEIKAAFRGEEVAASPAPRKPTKTKATGQSNWEKLQSSLKPTKKKKRA